MLRTTVIRLAAIALATVATAVDATAEKKIVVPIQRSGLFRGAMSGREIVIGPLTGECATATKVEQGQAETITEEPCPNRPWLAVIPMRAPST